MLSLRPHIDDQKQKTISTSLKLICWTTVNILNINKWLK